MVPRTASDSDGGYALLSHMDHIFVCACAREDHSVAFDMHVSFASEKPGRPQHPMVACQKCAINAVLDNV
jgi:hypothetical protein